MLEVGNLSVCYGKHQALAEIAINVKRGQVVTILGANGAGKTTLLKTIAGLVAAMPGEKRELDGKSLEKLSPREIVEAGVNWTREQAAILADFSAFVKKHKMLSPHACGIASEQPQRGRSSAKRSGGPGRK